ncbi:MAG: anaerobic nitric oxide reductase flavorubredoxin [Eubacteriales bacterium]|nr:anaerobic nitric oxide reductase flavorubredoxin [Eubacteriales bacterium]
MAKKVSDHITWVGKIDWELAHFHGDELSTTKGSSYNSYLVRGSEKTVLVDTVWLPYDKEFIRNLKQEIDLKDIDAVVMNHNEIDHSGSLPELMRELPEGTPIYSTKKGEGIIRGHYHQDWNFVNVKTGDKLDLGDIDLTFIEAPMLHWPDTMFTYVSGDEVLLSNDAFGQHFATESLFDDRIDMSEMMYECMKYYANILNLYSPMVARKIKELQGLNLPIKMIAPSHGVIWRQHPVEIVETYAKWAAAYQEDQITIVYDTMWQSTRKMAQYIAKGIQLASPDTTVKLYNAHTEDKNDILTEIFRSKAVLVGCPTINYGVSYAIAGILEMAKGLKFKNKKAAAFGSYGWSGDAPKQITEALQGAGFEIVSDPLKNLWVPDEEAEAQDVEYGKAFAEAVK